VDEDEERADGGLGGHDEFESDEDDDDEEEDDEDDDVAATMSAILGRTSALSQPTSSSSSSWPHHRHQHFYHLPPPPASTAGTAASSTSSSSLYTTASSASSSAFYPKLELLIDDHVLPSNMTIYQAIKQYSASSAQQPNASEDSSGAAKTDDHFADNDAESGFLGNAVWTKLHTIHYRLVTPPPPAPASMRVYLT
jgi:hypothetical protein